MERELSGADPATTNNRMELMAAISALEALKRPCKVVLNTDSEYVRNGISRWINGWVRNNWRNAAKDPVANMELWQRLLAAAKPHRGRLALGARPFRRSDERTGGPAGDRGAAQFGIGRIAGGRARPGA